MLTGFSRLEQLVDEHPDRKLQTLMHFVNTATLKEAHKIQEEGKASGVDKETKTSYGKDLSANVEDLISRMKSFSYRPQPVRRIYIEKEGGTGVRPLGIPAYEDKLVQRVMAEVLNIIYEPKFLDCSYGFREGRDCHQAILQLNKYLFDYTRWVVDADIRGFFDHVNHEWLTKFLEHEIADKNFIRYVKRFLKSGAMEDGIHTMSEEGVAQGGPISPVLANVYLHYVLDLWFEKRIKKSCVARADMVRYADDVVFCFEAEEDARRFYEELRERLAKFHLELSEEKSQIIPFGRFTTEKPGKFDFLGFTLVIGRSRKGKKIVKYRTSEKKLKAKRAKIKKFLRENMHTPVANLIKKLNVRLQGHYNYYGISHNSEKLNGFRQFCRYTLFKTLNRRSQRHSLNWDEFGELLKKFPIVAPRIVFQLW